MWELDNSTDLVAPIRAVSTACVRQLLDEPVACSVAGMITCKSAEEVKKLRRAGAIVGDTLRLIREMVAPGVTLKALNAAAEALIVSRGAHPTFKGYHGFPAALCLSVNEQVVHGIPSKRGLKNGDVLSVDCGATLEGYVGDSAITVGVGEITEEKRQLLETTRASLLAGIEAARPGNTVGDVGAAIEAVINTRGYGIVREYCGHGIGTALHEDPQVPNYGEAGTGPTIEAGWCLAIEPMVNLGSDEVVTLSDGWTVVTRDGAASAHFELAIAILADQVQILTLTSDGEMP